MTIKEAENKIAQAIETNGNFSHNICGIVLSGIAKEHGRKAANKLIDKFALDSIYGIQKVKEEDK